MFSFDVLSGIMVVNSIESTHFLIFRLDDVPLKWVCCCKTRKSAKTIQHSHGMLCIGEFVFFSRLWFSGSEHTKKYVEGSIDAFPRIQSGCQNSVFITMVFATVKSSF